MNIQRVVQEAFRLEHELNKELKKFHKLTHETKIPNILIFWLNAVYESSALKYHLVLIVLLLVLAFKVLWEVLFLTIFCFFPKRQVEPFDGLTVATSKAGTRIITSVLQHNFPQINCLNLRRPYSSYFYISITNRFEIISGYLYIILSSIKSCNITCILQIYQLFELQVIASIVYENNNRHIFSDDQMQRFSFVISNLSNYFHLCQHGQQDTDLKLTSKFGSIYTLWYLDEEYVEAFNQYYKRIKFVKRQPNSIIFSNVLNTKENPGEKRVIFIASSITTFDTECNLIASLSTEPDIFIVLKFHPAHKYTKSQVTKLIKEVDYVCGENEYPICDQVYCYEHSSIAKMYLNKSIVKFLK